MKRFSIFLFCMFVLGGSLALADTVAIGDPSIVGSWGQRFEESGVGDFNFIGVIWLGGDTFEPPAIRNFSNAGWTSYGNYATGNTLNVLQFDLIFNGATAGPTQFIFGSFLDNTATDIAKAWWDQGWHFQVLDNSSYSKAQFVPEPGVLILLGLGLGGLSLVCLKMRP